jgi:hypothetical protein
MPPLPATDLADDAYETVVVEAAAATSGWRHDLRLVKDGITCGRRRDELNLSDLLLRRLLARQCSNFLSWTMNAASPPWVVHTTQHCEFVSTQYEAEQVDVLTGAELLERCQMPSHPAKSRIRL